MDGEARNFSLIDYLAAIENLPIHTFTMAPTMEGFFYALHGGCIGLYVS